MPKGIPKHPRPPRPPRPARVPCAAEMWRCANCDNAVSQGRVTNGTGCPKCPGAEILPSTCRRLIIPPATVCRHHGGGAPQVKAAVTRKAQRSKAEVMLAKLAIPIAGTEPIGALQDQLDLHRGIVSALTDLVNGLNLGITNNGVDGIAGHTYHQSGLPTGEAKPHVFVVMLKDWSDAYSRLAADCAKIGIEERRTAVAERIDQGTLDRLQAALNVALAVLDPAQAALFRQTLAAELPRQDPPAIER